MSTTFKVFVSALMGQVQILQVSKNGHVVFSFWWLDHTDLQRRCLVTGCDILISMAGVAYTDLQWLWLVTGRGLQFKVSTGI